MFFFFFFYSRVILKYLKCMCTLQTGVRCVDCGYSCHEKCAENVPKNCTKYKAIEGNQTQTLTRSGHANSVNSNVTTLQVSIQVRHSKKKKKHFKVYACVILRVKMYFRHPVINITNNLVPTWRKIELTRGICIKGELF